MQPPMPPPQPSPRRVAEPVAALLRAARDAERQAAGSDRRVAFRLTRVLLGGARAAGHNAAQLAACLDLSASAVRDRGGADGWVPAASLAPLAGPSEAQLQRWHEAGLLAHRSRDAAGQDCYLASELIQVIGRPPS
jgi:hypothetical protein